MTCYRIDRRQVVKVADFGLARMFSQEKEYYRPIDRKRALPVKWMAIESITDEIFTTKSDVVGRRVSQALFIAKRRPLFDLHRDALGEVCMAGPGSTVFDEITNSNSSTFQQRV